MHICIVRVVFLSLYMNAKCVQEYVGPPYASVAVCSAIVMELLSFAQSIHPGGDGSRQANQAPVAHKKTLERKTGGLPRAYTIILAYHCKDGTIFGAFIFWGVKASRSLCARAAVSSSTAGRLCKCAIETMIGDSKQA